MQVSKEARAAAEVQLDASRHQCALLDSRLRSTAKSLQLSEEARSAAADDISQLTFQLEAAQVRPAAPHVAGVATRANHGAMGRPSSPGG
jgi:hypothetical protein